MVLKLANNAVSTLQSSISSSATSIAIAGADAGKFPVLGAGDWHPATLKDLAGNMEIVKVTARSGGTLTVVRGQEGTAAKAFASGVKVELRATAAALLEIYTKALGDHVHTISQVTGLQTALDLKASTTDLSAALAALVDAAPGTLDTLNELAAALGDDPNFAATITASLATKLAILQPFVNVASAATADIGAAGSENVQITGTTTITSFGTAPAGTIRRLRFAASLTLTHNATTLNLPRNANIVTSADDTCIAISLGSGNWFVAEYNFNVAANERAALGLGALAVMDLTDLFYTGTSNANTNFPVGSTILVITGTTAVARNAAISPALFTSDTAFFTIVGNANAGTALTGTWRARGKIIGDSSNQYYQAQRTA